MATITDLTGYTWVGNDSGYVSEEQSPETGARLDFTCDNVNYSTMQFKHIDIGTTEEDYQLFYDDTKVYSFIKTKTWDDQKYRTIKITGGDHVKEASVIGWLERNGTLTINSSLKLGENNVNKLYLGTTEIQKAYLGSVLIYQK